MSQVLRSYHTLDWQNIQRGFTAKVPAEERPAVWGSRADKQEQAIWQRRFWEHRIRDERDFANHVQYIHYNPVNKSSLTPFLARPHEKTAPPPKG